MFELPQLPYDYSALEPYIDEETMRLHHTKHHQTYVTKLNEALAKHPEIQIDSAEELLKQFQTLPEDIQKAVRNHGGGHSNHSLFWTIMSKSEGSMPSGKVEKAINSSFGSFEEFKEKFSTTATTIFGSGWAWLAVKDNSLVLLDTANQDSPILQGMTPIFALDVWEHAYYLKYQNKRADYIAAWWNIINWEEVERRFEEATK